uniref:ATP-binding cassette, subfamily C, LapB n=1 Tax=Candidatus Kentrum sp. DK TaxID=2126562 RepID=A0A450SFM2_9GAMM|nr:MAG: ATP-binding cassette, subfamily C, LapB [Candidatus Kentron sp. DK]
MDQTAPDADGNVKQQEALQTPYLYTTQEDPLLECLVFLSHYHGNPKSAEVLKAGLPTPDHGKFTPNLFVRAAERAGFKSRVVERRLENIPDQVLPAVLMLGSGRACVMLERVSSGEARVFLPETGGTEETISTEELNKDYVGFAIYLKPDSEVSFDRKEEAHERGTSWFWGAILKNWWRYAQVGLAAIFINLFALVSPLFIMTVYDRVIPNNATETLWVLATGVATVIIFDLVLKSLRAYFIDAAGKKTDVELACRIFDQVLDMRMGAGPSSAGAFANTLREFETLREFFTSATLVALIDLPFALLFILVLWLLSGPVALVLAVAVPVILIYAFLIQIPLNKVVRKNFRESELKHGVLVETIGGLETIKSISAEARMRRIWESVVGLTARSSQKARAYSTSAVNFTGTVQQLTSVGVVLFGVHLIKENEITVGALIACVMLGGRAIAPLAQVAQLMTRLNQSRSSLDALDKIMKAPVERPPSQTFVHRPRLNGEITFRGVSFTYPGREEPALNDISFSLSAGERVGFIGRVGSGKTTIVKLILALFENKEGSILVDGTDIRQIDPMDLRRNIGYVAQEPFLFQGTLKDNITASAPHVGDAAVLKAVRLAGIDEFLSQSAAGLDLRVGERGDGLSGGQRQGVTVARALLRNPPILVLDEPTSAMDMTSEAMLKKKIADSLPGRTLILATHKLSMLSLVERVIVIDRGKIVVDGSKDEVLRQLKSGEFRSPKAEG